MPSKIPFVITYKKPGTTPPLFLAGSFSDPEWHPKEMQCTTDEDGELTFQSDVMIETGKDYQFKFRVGEGDWWILAEDYATATDDFGNKNNVLNVPSSDSKQANGEPPTEDASILGEPKASLPTAGAQIPQLDEPKDESDDLKTPLFAHECLGAYTFPDDESEEESYPSIPMRRYVESRSTDYGTSDVDLNDPTIERFPSDRNSIMDALRTIQTHLNEDQTHLKDIPPSPRVVSGGRASIDSAEEMILSPVALSPNTTRRRDSRLSHSSIGRTRSAVSLGSIAEEEPKASETVEDFSPGQLSPVNKAQDPPPVVTLPNPNTAAARDQRHSPPSEEDEAVAMKSPKAVSNGKPGKMTPTQSAGDDLVPDQSSQETGIAATNVSQEGTEVDLQQRVDQSKAPLEPSCLNEAGFLDSDKGHATMSMESTRDKQSDTQPRADAAKGRMAISGWLRVLLTSVRYNRLRMLLATGVVAVAMGIRWWNGSEK